MTTRFLGRQTGPFLMTYDSGRPVGVMLAKSEKTWAVSCALLGRGFLAGWAYRSHRGTEGKWSLPREAPARPVRSV